MGLEPQRRCSFCQWMLQGRDTGWNTLGSPLFLPASLLPELPIGWTHAEGESKGAGNYIGVSGMAEVAGQLREGVSELRNPDQKESSLLTCGWWASPASASKGKENYVKTAPSGAVEIDGRTLGGRQHGRFSGPFRRRQRWHLLHQPELILMLTKAAFWLLAFTTMKSVRVVIIPAVPRW